MSLTLQQIVEYATYVQILTWFFDSLSTLLVWAEHCRSAINLNEELPNGGYIESLGISVAVDSEVFRTDVYSISHPPTQSPRPGSY
ncbi:hypothetical protein EI94DRAFT_1798657 [Lactarius quietus]|nr:hypothetical protein EI94DRAFT_1798657 [Lactarius quietus]